MNEYQRQAGSVEFGSLSASRASGRTVEVQSIDGEAVQLPVTGSETVSQIRQVALEQLGALTSNADKYIVVNSEGRVIDDGAMLDQLFSGQEMLRLQLLPQAAFGPWRYLCA